MLFIQKRALCIGLLISFNVKEQILRSKRFLLYLQNKKKVSISGTKRDRAYHFQKRSLLSAIRYKIIVLNNELLMETERLSYTVAETLRQLPGMIETWYYTTTIHIYFTNMKHFQNIFGDSSLTFFLLSSLLFEK